MVGVDFTPLHTQGPSSLTYEGNIFTSTMNGARPPAAPAKPSSTPADVFPEIHKAFLDSERLRMANVIERCAGCVDLRQVDLIKSCTELDPVQHQAHGDTRNTVQNTQRRLRDEKSFQVLLNKGGSDVFEAHSALVAKEWVEQLTALVEYWRRRHRVE